ncbi:Kinesin light chain [Symbiodinium microadriaticum]|uniref:Kinesin light chain n=1 Tax=Symbiodinium microadriaticum TaxID=2951 RepID=A0A1Q9EVS2_SYMMI|nr:Kinesin light chain [Symbiodinium microadriaticum]
MAWCAVTTKSAVADFYRAAQAWFAQGEDAKARDACEKALKLADELRPLPAEMGDALHLLGACHLRLKAYALAIKCFERAMLVKQMASTDEDQTASMAATLLALGGAHLQTGSPVKAARCLQTVVATLEELGDAADELMLASAYQSLAGSYRAAGQHGQALQCYNLCLELREAKLGAEHAQLIPVLNNLGAQAQQLLRYKEAAGFYRRALSLERQSLGTEHIATATTLANLGSVLAKLKEHADAVTCLRRALEIQRAELGEDDPTLATTLHNLGNALASCGHVDEGERYMKRDFGDCA